MVRKHTFPKPNFPKPPLKYLPHVPPPATSLVLTEKCSSELTTNTCPGGTNFTAVISLRNRVRTLNRYVSSSPERGWENTSERILRRDSSRSEGLSLSVTAT